MIEMYTSKRAIFSEGRQKKFLDIATEKLGGVEKLAKTVGLSGRTIRDWRREKFSMDFVALEKICCEAGIKIPEGIETKNRYWYTNIGGKAGGRIVYKKYGVIGGDPELRKAKWRKWWEREGRYMDTWKRISRPYPFSRPRQSGNLAEFIGIMLGDGGISRYQLTITLHSIDDKEYAEFVIELVKRLFNVPVSTRPRKKDLAVNLVISRVGLVNFCTKTLGLKVGNKVKQNVDIPDWIKRNKKYKISCLRGLVDTDGSVFTHSYKVKGKIYKYKKLSFTSLSGPLLVSVHNIMDELGIKARVAGGKDIRIDSAADMEKYFSIVGSNNPKHLKRYKN